MTYSRLQAMEYEKSNYGGLLVVALGRWEVSPSGLWDPLISVQSKTIANNDYYSLLSKQFLSL
jgi:hypothetical protein